MSIISLSSSNKGNLLCEKFFLNPKNICLIDLNKKLESDLDQQLSKSGTQPVQSSIKDSGYSESELKLKKTNQSPTTFKIKRQHTIRDQPNFYNQNKHILAPHDLASYLTLIKHNNNQSKLKVFDEISQRILKPKKKHERKKLQRMNTTGIQDVKATAGHNVLTKTKYLNRSMPSMNADLLFSSTTSISVSKIRAEDFSCSHNLLNKTNGFYTFFLNTLEEFLTHAFIKSDCCFFY